MGLSPWKGCNSEERDPSLPQSLDQRTSEVLRVGTTTHANPNSVAQELPIKPYSSCAVPTLYAPSKHIMELHRVTDEAGGGGCGGGGADVWLFAHVCPCVYAACNESKMGQCQCAGPFGWTDQPETPYACSLRRQVPGVPGAKLTQPQGEEKDSEARPPHPPHSFGGRGAQSFPSPRRWMPWIRSEMRNDTWTCLPGQPDPLHTVTTCIREMTRSNKLPSLTNDQESHPTF